MQEMLGRDYYTIRDNLMKVKSIFLVEKGGEVPWGQVLQKDAPLIGAGLYIHGQTDARHVRWRAHYVEL